MKRLCFIILAGLILSGTSVYSIDKVFSGKGSWYGDKFHGRKTANGERYDMNKYTAAHKTLPFGTILKVTNKANGKSVIVRVNDRGPFVKNRVIDLSKKSAQDLGYLKAGVADLVIEILSRPGQKEKDQKEFVLGPVGKEDEDTDTEEKETEEIKAGKEEKEGIGSDIETKDADTKEKDGDIDDIMGSLQSDLKEDQPKNKKKKLGKDKPTLKEKDSKEVLIDFDKPSSEQGKDENKKDFEGVYQIFVIQLGAFSFEDKALAFQKKLADKGIETYVAKVERDSMILYKVREKSVYKDLNKVKERWQQLKKMGFECFVIGKYFFGS